YIIIGTMNAQSLHDARWHTIVLQKEGIEFAVFDADLTLEYACCDFGKAGESLFSLIPELEGMEETLRAAMQKSEEMTIPRLNRQKDGQTYYVDLRLIPIGEKLLVVFKDISPHGWLEQAVIQQRNEMYLIAGHFEKSRRALEETSNLDELTRLFNRRAANQILPQKFQRASLQQHPIHIIFLDLDNLKQINDQHGHNNGDLALQFLADTLRAHIRDEDIAIRWGGDEFVVILSDSAREGAYRIARALLSHLDQKPMVLRNGESIYLKVSIGICSIPPNDLLDKVSLRDAIRMADEAMYLSKKNGGHQITSFDIGTINGRP
ncbi:MAG: diguanylate cyclase, partial [Candidatus Villigracilaceae bacterium]